MSRLSLSGLGIALALAAVPAVAQTTYAIKAGLAGVDETNGDFGLLGRGHSQQAYLDATPWAHFQFSPAWSGFLRVRLFAPTGTVLTNAHENNNIGPTNKAFLGLREAWIDYAGFSYPGESIRIGRQRLREDDAMYWDQDIDAARWIFNTTLLQSQFGVGREFSTYRTDGANLPLDQRHRTYVFGTLSSEWRAYQRAGIRVLYADDTNRLPVMGQPTFPTTKLDNGHQVWLGAFFDNHYYDGASAPAWAYDAAFTWQKGHRRTALIDPVTRTVNGVSRADVSAWEANLGLRYRLPMQAFPLQLGAAYVYSSGGHAGDLSSQFSQTGLQSNYSRFTGTDSLTQRFTDAYRAELGNMKIATAYASVNLGRWNSSVIYNRYERVHGDAPIYAENIVVNPVNDSRSLGDGYDLVITRFFGGRVSRSDLLGGEEPESSVRLRASLFRPGAAYGPNTRSEYRVLLEVVLWR